MRQRSWWLCGTATVIALPVAALGLAIALIDPDDYKAELSAAVQEATGRAFTLGGPLRISRSLWPTIEVNDVKLANLPGGTRPDMARAERIEAQLSLPALLRRNIQVISLSLVGPDILFEQVDGHSNWVFDDVKEAVPVQQAPGPRMTLSVQTVQVRNGMVTFRLPARTKVVGIRSLHSEHPVENGPLAVDAVLVYSDYAPFSLRAAAQPTGNIDDPWTTQLDFAAYDTSATAKGTMNLAGDYDLQMTATSPTLEKLNALLPSMRLPALHQATIATHLTNGPVRGDIPVIGATRLHIGSVDLADRIPGLSFGAVDVALPKAGAAAAITGAGSYSGQAFTLAGSFGVPEHPDGRAVMPVDLTAAAAGQKAAGRLGVKGKVTLNTGIFDGLDVAMTLQTPALAGFRAVSPILPTLTDMSFAAQVTVPADAGSISLHNASLSTHEADLGGDVQIGLGGARPLVAKLHGVRVDVDAMLDAFGIVPAAQAPSRTVIPDTPLPWPLLRGPDIDLKAAVSALHYQRRDWKDLDIAMKLQDGQLKLDLPGAFAMALTADARADEAPVSLAVRAAALPMATVMRVVDLPGQASGAMQIDAQLHTAGRSLHDLAASLDGSFAATVTGGSISNAAMIQLAAPALQALSITVPAQGETAIRCLGVVGAFSKGLGRFRTLALDTSYLQLDGAGQVDLGAETLALKLHPLAELTGSHVAVPVLLDGSFRAPNGRLDASGLDKVGLLVDALFGGDHPPKCNDAGLAPRAP